MESWAAWRNTPARAGKTPVDLIEKALRKKHPRSRGENPGTGHSARNSRETPPLARGKQSYREDNIQIHGYTPARAGKTGVGFRSGFRHEKHPRSRGENFNAVSKFNEGQETPPLARGKRVEVLLVQFLVGNTPARAGKTTQSRPPQSGLRKHPRSRGENEFGKMPPKVVTETPPLARGKLFMASIRSLPVRNTPARAGKTAGYQKWVHEMGKHPRSRGEN